MSGKNSKTRITVQTQLQPGPQTVTTVSRELSDPAEAASTHANPDIATLKLEVLASLRKDIADIFKKELQDTLGDALSTIKLDLQAGKHCCLRCFGVIWRLWVYLFLGVRATDNGFVEDYRVPDFDYNPPNTGPVVVNYSHDEPPATNRTPDNNFDYIDAL
ncbi:hypothetical protein NFI96_009384 [Prochilodus magdalenae]|nr:hypothetical protein NFI96_009384 [Prochilodus magdalenae]